MPGVGPPMDTMGIGRLPVSGCSSSLVTSRCPDPTWPVSICCLLWIRLLFKKNKCQPQILYSHVFYIHLFVCSSLVRSFIQLFVHLPYIWGWPICSNLRYNFWKPKRKQRIQGVSQAWPIQPHLFFSQQHFPAMLWNHLPGSSGIKVFAARRCQTGPKNFGVKRWKFLQKGPKTAQKKWIIFEDFLGFPCQKFYTSKFKFFWKSPTQLDFGFFLFFGSLGTSPKVPGNCHWMCKRQPSPFSGITGVILPYES